jgi:hypothetical protein
MAGWLKKKRMGGNVQKLWEDKDAYGSGFHGKLFNEEVEEKEKKDDEMEECGPVELDRIAQLTAPEAGGDMGGEEEEDEDETEVTIKIEKEERGESDDESEDEGGDEEEEVLRDKEEEEPEEGEEELDEGLIGDLLGILGVGADELNVDLKDPKVKKELQDFLAKASASRLKKAASELEGEDGPHGSMATGSKSVQLSGDEEEKEDDDEEMEEGCKKDMKEEGEEEELEEGVDDVLKKLGTDVFAEPEAAVELVAAGLSALVEGGKIAAEGAHDLLTKLLQVAGGESENVRKAREGQEARKAAMAAQKAKIQGEEKEEEEGEEEMDEAGLTGSLSRSNKEGANAAKQAKDLIRRFSSVVRPAVLRTGMGTPAAKRLQKAGDDEEAMADEAEEKKKE